MGKLRELRGNYKRQPQQSFIHSVTFLRKPSLYQNLNVRSGYSLKNIPSNGWESGWGDGEGGGGGGYSSVYRVYTAAVGIGGSKHLLSLAPSVGEEEVLQEVDDGVCYLPRA